MLVTLAADVSEIRYIYVYSGGLIALLLFAFGGYSYFKRWMKADDTASSGAGFTLSDLRKLHDQGKISDEEYEKTRANMLASAKKMTQKLPEVFPGKTPRIPPAP